MGCPSRFAGGQRTVAAARKEALNAKARRAQSHVRLEQVQSAARQCKQEANSFESKSVRYSLGAVLYATTHRLQAQEYSSCSSSRLTLPSRGQLPACGLQLPLMSNVSPQIQSMEQLAFLGSNRRAWETTSVAAGASPMARLSSYWVQRMHLLGLSVRWRPEHDRFSSEGVTPVHVRARCEPGRDHETIVSWQPSQKKASFHRAVASQLLYRRPPRANPSVKRTVKRLRLLSAAYLKR